LHKLSKMAAVSKTAVSRVIAQEKDDEPKQRSREEYKKERELEEARKLGTAPAAVDEEGKDINPHIPQYISDAPWYTEPKGPTLKHQRPQEERQIKYSGIDDWYKKGVNKQKVATRYRKGACENCGAMTHKKRDCLERPRRVGAKFTGTNFAPDEYLNEQPSLTLSFDGKRDRWNGYDPSTHEDVVEDYVKMEELRKRMKKEKMTKKDVDPTELEDERQSSDDEDEDKYVDKMDMIGTKVDAAERYTVRNLRIREDTAKYLRNLDPNSAHYDPKTRSMRKNPYEHSGKAEDEVEFAGDNFIRISGDTVNHAKSQMFSWEAGAKGLDVHALAEPTKLEALKKEYEAKKTDFKSDAKQSVLEKYGGIEHLEAPPRELIFSQTEDYVEYTRHGKIIKGEEDPKVRSRYEEDVHPGNHTSIFGSYYADGKWGYACCHQFVRNSYCTGAAGKEAGESMLTMPPPKQVEAAAEEETKVNVVPESSLPVAEKAKKDDADSDSSSGSSDEEARKERERKERKKEEKQKKKREKKKRKKDKKSKKKKRKRKDSSSSSSSSGSDSDDFESKVKAAMKKQEEEEKKADQILSMDERKRTYNSMGGMDDNKQMTEAEMEAYYRKRQRTDDPMAAFLGKD